MKKKWFFLIAVIAIALVAYKIFAKEPLQGMSEEVYPGDYT